MKKIILVFLLCLGLSMSARAQSGGSVTLTTQLRTSVSATGSGLSTATTNYHQITWTVSGTTVTCSITVDSSSDNTNWTVGGVIPAQSCIGSSGQSAILNIVTNFVRINVTITGGGLVQANYFGYSSNGGSTSSNTVSSLGNPAYTGLVATRAGDTNNNVNAGVTWIMDRSMHIARQNLAKNSMKVVWGNWWVNGSSVEAGPGGTATFKYSIEYPLNTITLCTIGGQTTANVVSAANAISDACNPTIPNGAAFWIRTLYTNAAGIVFSTANYSTTGLEGAVFGTGTPNDLTGGGVVASGAGVGFHPYAIIGTTTLPSVCLIGDSRVTGQGDFPNDATLDIGEEARSIGPTYPYLKIAVPGTSLVQAVVNFTLRLTIAKYCTYAIDAYGINDIGGGGSGATVAGNRTTMAGLLNGVMPSPGIVFGTTLPTETTSTDSWATIANQTTSGNPSVVQTFNGLVRAGITGEANNMDIAYAVDPTAIGKFPVAPNLFATTGTAGFGTTDGVHETNTLNQIITRSGVVNVGWIRY